MGQYDDNFSWQTQFVVDQQLRQVQNLQALQPINGPRIVGVDGSKTPPQVSTVVSPMDGDLPRPSGSGVDFYRKARCIRRDPTIRMIRELSMAPLLMAEWEYESDDDCPPELRELVETTMARMRLSLLRTSLCGQCDYGWQPYEVIQEPSSTSGWTVPRLKPLLQDMTNVLVNAADGSFFGLRQTPVIGLRIGWIYLLDRECFVVSQDVEGTNWYGEPTLRSLEQVYDEAEEIFKQSRKYDRKIAGTHWVVKYPLGTSKYGGVEMDNGEIAIKILEKAEAVGGIVVPQSVKQIIDKLDAEIADSTAAQWSIELLSDQGKGQVPFLDKLKMLDVYKVRAFGWPERAVLEGQFGTKAEAGEHADVAVSNLEFKGSWLVEQYNDKLVDQQIIEPNFGAQYRGCCRVKQAPLADDTRGFFEKLYLAIATNPQGFMQELSVLDMGQLRDRLGLPAHPGQAAVDPMTGMTIDPMTGQPAGQPVGQAPQFADDYASGGQGDGSLPLLPGPSPDGRPAAPVPATFSIALGYDPSEARVPAGDREGGEWTADGGGGNGKSSASAKAGNNGSGDAKTFQAGAKKLLGMFAKSGVGTDARLDTTQVNSKFGVSPDVLVQRGLMQAHVVPGRVEGSQVTLYSLTDAAKQGVSKGSATAKTSHEQAARAVYDRLQQGGAIDPKTARFSSEHVFAWAGASAEELASKNILQKVQVPTSIPGHTQTQFQLHPKVADYFAKKQPKKKEAEFSLRDDVDRAAGEARKPTKKQREAGNYRKGHVRLHGLDVSIETRKGKRRHPDWPRMRAHYGYIKRTDGADGAQVDVFVGPDPSSEICFVINQATPDGRFDEHKVMLGFSDQRSALRAYKKSYRGSEYHAMSVVPMTIRALREWLTERQETPTLSLAVGIGEPNIIMPKSNPEVKAFSASVRQEVSDMKKRHKKERRSIERALGQLALSFDRLAKRPQLKTPKTPKISVPAPVVHVAAPDFGPLIAALRQQNEFDLEPERDANTGLVTRMNRVPKRK